VKGTKRKVKQTGIQAEPELKLTPDFGMTPKQLFEARMGELVQTQLLTQQRLDAENARLNPLRAYIRLVNAALNHSDDQELWEVIPWLMPAMVEPPAQPENAKGGFITDSADDEIPF